MFSNDRSVRAPRVSPFVLALTLATLALILVLHYWAKSAGDDQVVAEIKPNALDLFAKMRSSLCSPGGTSQRVHLRTNVTALVFAHNHTACFDRIPPILYHVASGHLLPQQLPSNSSKPLVSRWILCTQAGFDGKHTLWQCEGQPDPWKENPYSGQVEQRPSITSFGDMFIWCEGWDRPGDDYVHQGACVLQYDVRLQPLMPGAPVRGIAIGHVL